MVLIWGRRGFTDHLGLIVLECPKCQEYRPFGVYQQGKKFTLYFIPTFSYDKRQVAICGACSYAFEIPKNMKKELESILMSEDEFERIKVENPKATINSREAAYYYKIFRQFHPQDSVLGSIGIWTGFDFAEERERVRGTMDGCLKHVREDTYTVQRHSRQTRQR